MQLNKMEAGKFGIEGIPVIIRFKTEYALSYSFSTLLY